MNNEINIMIELQHYWNLVMQKEAELERHKKSIQLWDKRLADLKETVIKKENILKNARLKSKQSELKLEDIDVRIKKIEQRKDSLKSEREIEAQNNELKRLKEEKDLLESTVLEIMEQIDDAESELKSLGAELSETVKQTEEDITLLKSKITKDANDAQENRNKFNEMLNELSPAVKTRFAKLINSKDGIGIAALNGEICSHCNFQVPSAIVASTVKRESLNTCTNCGRFIY